MHAARTVEELPAEDLDALGDAAWWIGYVEESLDAYEAVYRRFYTAKGRARAATAAIGSAANLSLRGDEVVSSDVDR